MAESAGTQQQPRAWRSVQREGYSLVRMSTDLSRPTQASVGTLGGLVAPRHVAIAEDGTIYLLTSSVPYLEHFDTDQQRYVSLCPIGGTRDDRGNDGIDRDDNDNARPSRNFRDPGNIVCIDHLIYIADPSNRCVLVFDIETGALTELEALEIDESSWLPNDLLVVEQRRYILDGLHGRVFVLPLRDDRPELFIHDAASRWNRLAVDQSGNICLLDARHPNSHSTALIRSIHLRHRFGR